MHSTVAQRGRIRTTALQAELSLNHDGEHLDTLRGHRSQDSRCDPARVNEAHSSMNIFVPSVYGTEWHRDSTMLFFDRGMPSRPIHIIVLTHSTANSPNWVSGSVCRHSYTCIYLTSLDGCRAAFTDAPWEPWRSRPLRPSTARALRRSCRASSQRPTRTACTAPPDWLLPTGLAGTRCGGYAGDVGGLAFAWPPVMLVKPSLGSESTARVIQR